MRRISRLIVTGCVLVALLAACSSSSKGSGSPAATGPTGPVLTKSEYIQKADAICKAYGAKIRGAANAAVGTLNVQTDRALYQKTLIPLFRGQLSALSRLRPPKADEATIQEYLSRLSDGITSVAAAVSRAQALTDFDILPSGLTNAEGIAETYGMKDC